MTREEILKKVDHTILKPDTTWEDVKQVCDDAIKFRCASVCIPPCFVREAKEYVQDKINVCTVIGFPCGYQRLIVKTNEAIQALCDGADELDVVINIGKLKEKKLTYIQQELIRIKNIAEAYSRTERDFEPVILKAIIEAGLLTKEEIEKVCKVVISAGFDYVKTSTGFFREPISCKHVEWIKAIVGDKTKIKASGSISTFEIAEQMLEAGADRVGASKLVNIYKKERK